MQILQNAVAKQSHVPSVIAQPYTSKVLTIGCLLSLVILVTGESKAGVLEQECSPPSAQIQMSHLQPVVPSLTDTTRAQQWPCRSL